MRDNAENLFPQNFSEDELKIQAKRLLNTYQILLECKKINEKRNRESKLNSENN